MVPGIVVDDLLLIHQRLSCIVLLGFRLGYIMATLFCSRLDLRSSQPSSCSTRGSHCSKTWQHASTNSTLAMLDFVTGSRRSIFKLWTNYGLVTFDLDVLWTAQNISTEEGCT